MDLSRDYDDFPTGGLNRGKKSFLGRNSRILHFIMAGIQRSIPDGRGILWSTLSLFQKL